MFAMAKSDFEDSNEPSSPHCTYKMVGEVDGDVLDACNDSTIHSGHFMLTRVHEKDSDNEGERPPSSPKKIGYDFQTAKLLPAKSYKFGNRSTTTLAIDADLTKLFDCMTLAYSGKLTSPKWKDFKGIKLLLKDKIRLNNIIWREWHMQYIQGQRPVVCQFEPPISDKTHGKPEAVVLEGKYWKRRLESVTAEYKKWRMFRMEYRSPHNDASLAEMANRVELPERMTPPRSHGTAYNLDSLMTDEDFIMDLSDTLFTSLSQPFAFPNPKELSQLGNADIIQPGLVQLQPSLDDFMDTLEPLQSLQEILTATKNAFMPMETIPETGSFNDAFGQVSESSMNSNRTQIQQVQPSTAAQFMDVTPVKQEPRHQMSSSNSGMNLQDNMSLQNNSLEAIFGGASARKRYPSAPSATTTTSDMAVQIINSMFSSTGDLHKQNRAATNITPNIVQLQHPFQPTQQQTQSLPQSLQVQHIQGHQLQVQPAAQPQQLQAQQNQPQQLQAQQIQPQQLQAQQIQPQQLQAQQIQSQQLQAQQIQQQQRPVQVQHQTVPASVAPPPQQTQTAPRTIQQILNSMANSGSNVNQTPQPAGKTVTIIQNTPLQAMLQGGGGAMPQSTQSVLGECLNLNLVPVSSEQLQALIKTEDQQQITVASTNTGLTPTHFSEGNLQQLSRDGNSVRRASTGSLNRSKTPPRREGTFLVPQTTRVFKNKPRSIAPAPVPTFTAGPTVEQPTTAASQTGFLQQNTVLAQLLTNQVATLPTASVMPSIKQEVQTAPGFSSLPTPSAVISLTTSTVTTTSITNPAFSFSLPTSSGAISDFQKKLLLAAVSQATGFSTVQLADSMSSPPHGVSSLSSPINSNPGSPQTFSFPNSPATHPASMSPSEPTERSRHASNESTGSANAHKEDSPNKGTRPKEVLERQVNRRVSHITAEQKRRGNIKVGFEVLNQLVPTINQSPNAKISKAATLQKAAEYCRKLKQERAKMHDEAEVLRQEIESLNGAISVCQSQLPATGVPVTRQRADRMREMLDEYVKNRTLQNWKFWIFSIVIRSLFDSYNNMVSTTNIDELCRTVISWLEQHCSLVALRPTVLSALRHITTTTSILSDPSRVPEQATQAVIKKTDDLVHNS